jgi:hypothetical protein
MRCVLSLLVNVRRETPSSAAARVWLGHVARDDDGSAIAVREAELAVGVAGDDELAAVELSVVAGAQAHAVASRVLTTLGLLLDVLCASPARPRRRSSR